MSQENINIGLELLKTSVAAQQALILWVQSSYPVGTEIEWQELRGEVISSWINPQGVPSLGVRNGDHWYTIYPLTETITVVEPSPVT